MDQDVTRKTNHKSIITECQMETFSQSIEGIHAIRPKTIKVVRMCVSVPYILKIIELQ